MVGRAPKTSSGIEPLDDAWGGLYAGGSYLVYGRAASGRRLLPIMLARAAAANGERSLLVLSREGATASAFSSAQVRELSTGGMLETVQGSQLGLVQEAEDDQLDQAVRKLIAAAEERRPGRVLVDDFMPFVRFRSFRRFRHVFVSMLERIDAIDATLMLLMARPVNEASEQVIEFMRSQMTGAIHIMHPEDDDGARSLELIPNIGHLGRRTTVRWDVSEIVDYATHRSTPRRFRFAEDVGDDVSPLEAEWDAAPSQAWAGGDHARPDSVPAVCPSSIHMSPKEAVTAHPLGRREHPRSADEPIEGRLQPIPLGRTRRSDSRNTASTSRHHEIYRTTSSPPAAPTSGAATDQFESPRTVPSHSDRDAFRMRLQQYFLRRNVDGSSFMLIAMRMEREDLSAARPFEFEFIVDLVSERLREEDDVYVDLQRERLVVVLADSRPDDSQPFFAQLKKRLREESPHQTEVLLKSVSAIVVADGQPFQNAEEFLTYALDEE